MRTAATFFTVPQIGSTEAQMFRFMMGELAVCVFLAGLLGTAIVALFLTGYLMRYLALMAVALSLPVAAMLKTFILVPPTHPPIPLAPVRPVVAEYLP